MKKSKWLAVSLGSLSILAPRSGWANEANSLSPPGALPVISGVRDAQRFDAQERAAIAPPQLINAPEWSQDLDSSSAQDPMAQVTSVSQLSDVKPGDWAFQALQTLVERYGLIVGYPDGTFRGNRSLTRDEFSVTLSAVLGKVEEQLLAGDIGGTAQQDVLTIRRLNVAYGNALSDLRSRLNTITSRSLQLDDRQFSTHD